MPKLKILSGPEVIRIFELFGFFVLDQRGSHIKLQRLTAFISDGELREHFYTKE